MTLQIYDAHVDFLICLLVSACICLMHKHVNNVGLIKILEEQVTLLSIDRNNAVSQRFEYFKQTHGTCIYL